MSCERFDVAITDHACGAAIAPDAQRHLETCDQCRSRFDEQRRAMQALDVELAQALAIAPSRGFEQMVHVRVQQMATAPLRPIWWAALATAAAAVIVIGLVAIRSTDEPAIPAAGQVVQAQPPGSRVPAIDPAPAANAGAPLETGRANAARRDRLTQTPPRRRVKPSLPEAEVIVASEHVRALERYMTLVRSGALVTSNLNGQTEIGGEPSPLVVAPLNVEPLTVSEVGPGTSPDRGPE
jgi:hypothetical protein